MFLRPKPPVPPPPEIGGVRVLLSKRARRMSLRTDARTGEVLLVFPPRASEKKARAFIEKNRDWILEHTARAAARPALAPGMTLDICGAPHAVAHRPGRGLSYIENGVITVRGDLAHFRRRLRDALRAEAEKILTARVREKTESLGLKMHPVRILDPKTRWGSCGHDGRLMLSWRLILAPEDVMDYVVAHEVAHRLHMNHGRKFWALCASLTKNAPASRRWLRAHGHELMALA